MIGSDGRNYIDPPGYWGNNTARPRNPLQYAVSIPDTPYAAEDWDDDIPSTQPKSQSYWQRLLAKLTGNVDAAAAQTLPGYNSPYGGMVSPASKAAAASGQQFHGPYYGLDGTRNVPLLPHERSQAMNTYLAGYQPSMVRYDPSNPLNLPER